MANVPCPPFYAPPSYTFTPYYTTGSFIRHYNDWYRCLVGPYCNAPSFLGYSPPGEGAQWTLAWSFVDYSMRFDCNPELESDDSQGAAQLSPGGLILTKKPTNAPTTIVESPSVISGVVWYDANGDGRRNDPNAALTKEDFDVSEKEMGAGIGNLRVLLRRCGDDGNGELVGVAYTFPFGMGVELGKATVFGADYLQEIQDFSSKGNGGDGGDILAGRIGYYSFRILPNQIPGEFYVVFEAPVGYRLTGGSGTYWEVQEEALKDRVFPMVEAKAAVRFLQVGDDDGAGGMLSNSTGIEGNETMAMNETSENATKYPNYYETIPTNKPSLFQVEIPDINDFIDAFDTSETDTSALGPITHSGYYSRSRCISIKTNPMGINQIDAGMTISSWPITPFQYASFILTLQFYEQSTNTERRELQEVISLECRNYEKLKSEGIIVEDIWGCETPINAAPQYDFPELSTEQGGEVVKIMKDFLFTRSGDFSLKNIGLTYQKIKLLEKNKDRLLLRDEVLLKTDQIFETAAHLRRGEVDRDSTIRRYAAAAEVARLELGFRIAGESEPTSSNDLTSVLLQAIEDDPKTLLSKFKASSSLPDYMEILGTLNGQKVLEVPQDNKLIDDNVSGIKGVSDSAGVSSGEIAGIVIGVLVLVGLLMAILVYHCKMKDEDSDSSSSDSSSDSSKVPTKHRSKIVERKFANAKEEDYSYESDSLSSRWYSDYEGSDVDEGTEEFNVKEAFYSGRMKPIRPEHEGRRSGKSTASSSSRGSSMVGSGVSRVRSAVSRSARSSALSVRSDDSRGSSRVNSAVSRVRSATSQSARSSFTSRASQSTHSSYISRDSQSTQGSVSRSTASGSASSKLRYNSSRKSRSSSRSSHQSSRISSSSRGEEGRSSLNSRKSVFSNATESTER